MQPAAYAVWVLVLQTAAYVNYLNFGLETAVGRYVAYANEKKDIGLRNTVFSTAFFGLCCAAFLSLICLAGAALAVHRLFPAVPVSLIPQMRLSILIVGVAMAIGLPASAWNGVFVGMARYEIPALTVGGSRLFSVLGIITAVLTGCSLTALAAIIASTNLLSYFAQYLAFRRMVPTLHFHFSQVLRSTGRELYGYCSGLTIISFGALLVSGFDLVLVGHFQFSVITPYSVAASLITLISGLLYCSNQRHHATRRVTSCSRRCETVR
jgi:O-antigen/teichoic acid export membrane protein